MATFKPGAADGKLKAFKDQVKRNSEYSTLAFDKKKE
jgi:hypothetical protein